MRWWTLLLYFFGLRCRCGGRWQFLRYTTYGHLSACDSCGAEVYETDN